MGHQVELNHGVGRDIGRLVIEATVQVDILEVLCPDRVPETLNRTKFLPFRILRFVYFHENVFADCICSATKHNHKCADEDRGVLVSSERLLAVRLVWGFDPIPATVPVSSQAPSIF